MATDTQDNGVLGLDSMNGDVAMALPQLTAQERAQALDKAMAARRERGRILAALKSGELSLEQVLERADPVVGATPVRRLLQALPGVGAARASQLLVEVGISPSRRARGLGRRQKEELLLLFPTHR